MIILFKRLFGKFFKKKVVIHEQLVEVTDNRDEERMDALISFSLENGTPVLVGSQERIDQYIARHPQVHAVGFTPKFTKHVLENINTINGVVLDETVLPQMQLILKENNIAIRGGFVRKEG